MLLLRRKIGKKIVINDSIEISVLKIHRNQVRLGISANKDVKVYRQEVYEKHYKNNPLK